MKHVITYGADTDNRYRELLLGPKGKAVRMIASPKKRSNHERHRRLVNAVSCEVVAIDSGKSCPLTGSYQCPECGLSCCGRHALYKNKLKGEEPQPFCPKCAEGA